MFDAEKKRTWEAEVWCCLYTTFLVSKLSLVSSAKFPHKFDRVTQTVSSRSLSIHGQPPFQGWHVAPRRHGAGLPGYTGEISMPTHRGRKGQAIPHPS